MVAGAVERDNDFFVGDIQGSKGYVSSVSPWADVVGVERDYDRVSCTKDWSLGVIEFSGEAVLLGLLSLIARLVVPLAVVPFV